MKNESNLLKRIAALMLTAALLLTCAPISALAVDEDATSETGTVYGDEETVLVSPEISGRETDFNTGWKFYLGDNSSASGQSFDDSSWEDVTLPHDFSISQDFTTSGEAESGYLLGGTGWYRKSFTLATSEAGNTIVLSFDGVYSDAYVYVNGTYVGENHYGYTSFAFDITDYLVCDGVTENVIAVKAVNNTPSSRWYSGSGIYRDVTLIVTEPVHVAYNGTYVTTPNISTGDGTVQTEVELDNDSDTDVEVTVKNTVYTSDGVSASESAEATATIGAGETVTVTSSPVVSSPALWSTDDPNLYFVRTEVYVNGTLTDTYDTEFGFRWFSYDDDTGFYLNGVATKLNGVCMHHDQGALGSAASYDAIYRQLSIMKDMGVNAIRTSHNPADEDFIDICNELGILVLEEAFDGWNVAKNGNSNDFAKYFSTAISADNNILGGNSSMTWAEYAIKSMVKRDRNDACVFMWSLGNEIEEGASTSSEFTTIVSNLIEWIQEVDDTRSFTLGDNTRGSNSTLTTVIETIVANGGIAGFNYASSSTLATLHSTYGAILSTETSSAVNSRGIYTTQASRTNADGLYHLTSYDTSAVSWGITAHESIWNTMTTDYILGEFVWTGFDYIGEPTPWNGTGSGSVSGSGAIPNSSYFGIVDTAGFEKDTYYLYRAQWNQDSTTLHLVTAWDEDNLYTNSDGQTPVVVYTNAAKVELYRNGILIGTATRTVNTTDAGHTYYTYTTESNNTSAFSAITGSSSTSLYATFNVTYEAGTISAIAYDEDGNVISDTSGNSVVSTPGTVSQLEVTQNKTVIDADGQSLVYIEVDVTDADGNLDTTATNTIYFTLTGDGEIVGVDNGDQATTEKYQQDSVLTSSTEAHIAAYAGKALVIVRSTTDAGSFTVNVTSDGLSGGSATVTTTAVESDTVTEGLVSYTLVRDYSVTVGTEPELLTTATGILADGSTVSGTVVWDEISSEIYNNAGDYTITGTLSFDGLEDITVIARLHVIADVIAMRNVSAVTMAGYVPTLPSTVNGVLADGTVTGEFTVTWDSVSADDFADVGDIITVNGTATVIGTTTLPVTCTVRVAEAVNTESTNVASSATLEQDILSDYQSDTLSSLNNGTTKPGDDTTERWSNYNYRNTSDTATLTLTWATAQLLSSVNLYYYVDSFSASLPASVEIAYSLDGTTYTSIGYTESMVESYTYGYEYSYEFDEVVNPISIQITLTEQSGKCVALTEIEAMTYAGSVETNTSADLSGIAVDGTSVSGFDADTLTYEADGTNDAVVTATTEVNAGITVLPIYTDGVVRILTISEDSSTEKTYEVTLSGVEACQHENTEVRNAFAATCTGEGYTGDTYCIDCDTLVEQGSIIPATGHSTVTQNAKAATCTEDGYTGDEVCTVCGETVSTGSVIAATGHSWDSGTVTKAATTEEEGLMTYTCTVCGETKTEVIPKLEETKELLVPSVTLSVSQNSGKIRLTGTVTDFENSDDYYEITGHGFVYITKAKLGAKTLSLNTSGRTKVTITGIGSTGAYSYSMTPKTSSTVYVIRAWVSYTNNSGKTVYVYSDPIYTSYDALTK
ncbi:MAG: DUF4982 domain-containing protein [Clostridiales bacterium]|nr:DUF4982 domain-containing protein [Clostridiales bacterium]